MIPSKSQQRELTPEEKSKIAFMKMSSAKKLEFIYDMLMDHENRVSALEPEPTTEPESTIEPDPEPIPDPEPTPSGDPSENDPADPNAVNTDNGEDNGEVIEGSNGEQNNP